MLFGGAPLGFVILIKNGPVIYHTGDTAAFGEMRAIGQRWHPDVMLACMGGHFTMDPRDAAIAARDAGVKLVVPMHYGTFPVLTGTPEELAKELKAVAPRAHMVQLQIGEAKAF